MPSAKVKRAIAAFEIAVEVKSVSRMITLPEVTLTAVEHNYVKARAKLERLMEGL